MTRLGFKTTRLSLSTYSITSVCALLGTEEKTIDKENTTIIFPKCQKEEKTTFLLQLWSIVNSNVDESYN